MNARGEGPEPLCRFRATVGQAPTAERQRLLQHLGDSRLRVDGRGAPSANEHVPLVLGVLDAADRVEVAEEQQRQPLETTICLRQVSPKLLELRETGSLLLVVQMRAAHDTFRQAGSHGAALL